MDEQIAIYTPDSKLKKPVTLVRSILKGLLIGRGLALRLFIRDLNSIYRQSLLGFFWLFMPPFLVAFIWIFLKGEKVLSIGSTELPYPLYVVLGTVSWSLFTGAVFMPLNTLQKAKSLLSKINFQHEALLMTSLLRSFFEGAVKFLPVILMFFCLKTEFSYTLLLLPWAVTFLIIFGFSIGVLLLPFGMLYGDIQKGLQPFFQMAFFLTPIIYPAPKTGFLAVISDFNPMVPFLKTIRGWTAGTLNIEASFVFLCSISILILFVGLILFKVSISTVIERNGS